VRRYDLLHARDVYRFACGPEGGNKRLMLRFIEVHTGVWVGTRYFGVGTRYFGVILLLSLGLPGMGSASRPELLLVPCAAQVSTLLLAPICPHTCEHIWGNLLKKPGLVVNGTNRCPHLCCNAAGPQVIITVLLCNVCCSWVAFCRRP
jgi:leucyl-tRNA synthetase